MRGLPSAQFVLLRTTQMSAVRLCREEGVNDIFSARSAKRGNTAPSGDGEMSCEARNLSDSCGFAQLSKTCNSDLETIAASKFERFERSVAVERLERFEPHLLSSSTGQQNVE
jgi:hypothetical protein